ncbi:DNA recombination protein RmuC [Altererythrobacter sp. Root672]|uniref:DNA recombination protein RmuC n=1 Tax=Altererythrobacter sp. Root672 TaxID=1736584 RepID=UPI0006F39A50|nr:DNA recombination protein RmuC [Altererythrobacter sp. Root672]KRA83835.1 DNA recombinase [Altererythrobacter sp. Root672]
MEPFLVIVIVLVALVAGAALGWFAGSRPVADWKARHAEVDAAAKEREGQFKQAVTELGQTRIENATLKANAENFDKQIAQLNEARAELLTQFKAAGSEVLSKAQEDFLKRAEERFGNSEKANKEAVSALLEPVNQRLKSYEEQVRALESQRVDAFGQLTGLIQSMREGQEAVRSAAQQLGNSLRNAPKARGRWGEQQLKNVLEQCGLAEHTDFVTEHSVDTDEGRLRPDAIVRIPGNKLLVIDAKVSLNAYQEAFEAADDAERIRHLDLHAASMRNHIQTLGAKSYQSQFEEAPDYVLMFVPGEHFIAAALEHDPRLWDFAFERRVLLASPTNLVAICRTVAQVWRQDGLAREAREIGRMGGELYDRLAKVTEDLTKVGTHLGRAVGSYNDFSRSFQSRVVVSAKRLRDKHIEIGKREIEDVQQIEIAPVYSPTDDAPTPRLVDISDDEDEARLA